MKKIRIKSSIMAFIQGTTKTRISLKNRIEILKLLIEIGELNEENLNY